MRMKILALLVAGIIILGLGCVSPEAQAPSGNTNTGTTTVPTNNTGNTNTGSTNTGNTSTGNTNAGGTGTGDTGTGNTSGNTNTVVEVILKNSDFVPNTISVSAGQTIHFVNQDGFGHDVHLIKDGVDFFPRTQINAGATIDVEITEAGTYELICDRHAPGMSGSIQAN